ncbi:MAG: carbohydrate kinase [Chitinivibrionales bacterium]|nr:carbohydrate kinase [Chitinivibrionales bacterium]MBD3356071.1 carbohydrate kinase [Chitinivibrionales bacterium]
MDARHIAVIDVGKTNKKVLIFDDRLKIVDGAYRTFDEYTEDGVHYEDVDGAFAWFKEQLTTFAASYPIRTVSVTTHGATAVCIDHEGKRAAPVVAYTTPADQAFREEFFETFGSPEELQRTTATAEIGDMINIAKVLFFIKKRCPESFARIATVLNYPQYIGYLLTGSVGAEPTYIGCHTYLFDFENKKSSSVAAKLGVKDKLPSTIAAPWDVLGRITPTIARQTNLSPECIVTMGIHDSNASLLPYLVKGYDDFVLNSTGTWCVAMHPTDKVKFEADELGKLVFYNLDAFSNPVKTSIFMGGLEFQTYSALLEKINGSGVRPTFDPSLYQKIISERRKFILPSVVRGTGIFPDSAPKVIDEGGVFDLEDIRSGKSIPGFFEDHSIAQAALELSLALQTRAALELIGYDGKGTIVTEGGWRKDKAYNALMAALYPESKLVTTDLAEATAFGAAILGKAALEGTTPMNTADQFEIRTEAVERPNLTGLEEYAEAFAEKL